MRKRTAFFLFVFIAATVAFAVWDPNLMASGLYKVVTQKLDSVSHWAQKRLNYETSPSPARSTPPDIAERPDTPAEQGTIRIASWNIRVFSSNSRSDEEIAIICNIMQQYDLIAIQELRDIAALERCVSELASRSRKYSFVASKPVGTSKSKELYAYLYRPDVVSHLGDPSIYDDHADRFIREPYIAHFRSGTFDFTMITTHILYGSGKKDPARAGELNAIADVFRQIQNADPSENDIILTGDFNEPPDSPRFAALVSIPTLQMIIQGTNVRTVIHDSSLYDNIVFQSQYTDREYTGIWGVYKFDEEMFGNDDQMASKVCSDHRPVWADFRTDAGDDD